MRILVALGGNAMTNAEGRARPEDQIAAAAVAANRIADLVLAGHDVVITHGNGPQVGNLLVKNELAAHVVPPVPLDWCGAQTQATLGFVLSNALDKALLDRGIDRHTAVVVTRTLVRWDDPGFADPSKPIGRYLPAEQAQVLIAHGETWRDFGTPTDPDRGWRRVVASPEPLAIVDSAPILTLVGAGLLVIAGGGGGAPVVVDAEGELHGVEAVIDKDLGAALLGGILGVDMLLIATDVPNVMIDFGTDSARPLGHVMADELAGHLHDGQFGAGSMGPKVTAALRFVTSARKRAAICALDDIAKAATGLAGTVVLPV
ncbi:carbamate kinase [soil metagenome]